MDSPDLTALLEALQKEAAGLDPRLLAGLGAAAGLGTGGVATHLYDKAQARHARNRTFGAGIAAGVALPGALQRGVRALQGAGLVPPGTVNLQGGGYGG